MTESGTFEKLSAFLESPINSEYFPEQYSTAVTVGMSGEVTEGKCPWTVWGSNQGEMSMDNVGK